MRHFRTYLFILLLLVGIRITFAQGLSSFTTKPMELTPRPHMNAATQALYDRIRSNDGWMMGLGALDNGYKNVNNIDGRLMSRDLTRWNNLYGNNSPVFYEFELGEPYAKYYPRNWTAARSFVQQGGIPWFRLHMKNFSYPQYSFPTRVPKAGTAWDTRKGIKPLLPGNEKNYEFNQYCIQLAREIKTFGYPCIFRPLHEMNGNWFWWCGQPDEYKQLWKIMFDTFQREHVTNVIWCWAPSGDAPGHFAYYPGDDYVDILGLDTYFDGYRLPGLAKFTLLLFGSQYKNKPLMFAEFGPVAKAEFWRSAVTDFNEIPNFRGMMFWWARGWKTWGNKAKVGSLIDESSPPETMYAFKNFLQYPKTITREKWNPPNANAPNTPPVASPRN